MSALHSMSYNKAYDEFSKLTLKQQKFLFEIHKMSMDTKYEWTLVAIAWQETLAGEALINVFDGGMGNASCGPYHNMLSSVFRRHKEWVPTKFNVNRVCSKLITDWRFSTKEAVAELDYWYKVRNGNWLKIWASYNAGTPKNGMKYAYKIRHKIRVLRKIVGTQWDGMFVHIK